MIPDLFNVNLDGEIQETSIHLYKFISNILVFVHKSYNIDSNTSL